MKMANLVEDNFSFAKLVGEVDILFITLDTLRFDVAQYAYRNGLLKNLSKYLDNEGWECRHSPASFTYAAHHAFFAGFLPTPSMPGSHKRLFASRFQGSTTVDQQTFVFEKPTLPQSLSDLGYRTVCIGGTGFFNPASPIGSVFPSWFDESHWSPNTSVASKESEKNQIELAIKRRKSFGDHLTMMFINVAAIHQPNWFYDPSNGSETDDLHSHLAALVAVDAVMEPLFEAFRQFRKTFCILCSDHGTAYGEGGFWGHRIAHEVIWNVPYAQFFL